ncbi:MAG: hypothetical protein J6K64_02945 [Clostridia bacterium]|nr:hypothetical protein [Clostridia bacterium]
MTFKEIIETYGKELSYNCTINSHLSVKVADITDEHIISVNHHFDGALYTSVMRCLDIVLKGDHRAVRKGYRIKNNKFTAQKDGNEKTIDYGSFVVAEAPEYDEGADTTKFICYDLMYTTMREYKLKVTFPITLKAYLELIAETCGFTIANIEDLRNGAMQITSEQYLNVANDTGSSYLYRDVLDDIARCAGCSFAFKSDANGDTIDELYIVYVTDGNGAMKESKFTLDVSNFKTLTIGEHYGPANTVVFSRQPQEDNVYLKADDIADGEEVEVKLHQPLIAEGTDNERAAWLTAILEAVKGTQYQCYSLESFGIGYMNFGDVFTIKAFARDGLTLDYDSPEEYQTVFMRSDMLINGDVKESTKLEMPVATSTDYSAATTESEKRMLEAYMKVDKRLGKIVSIVTDPKTGLETKTEQNAEAISAQTKKIETIEKAGYITESQAQGLIEASSESIALSVSKNLKIGTRNILLDSACFEKFTLSSSKATPYYSVLTYELTTSDSSYPSGKVKTLAVTPAANAPKFFGVRYKNENILGETSVSKIKPNQPYTLSFWLSDDALSGGETRKLSKTGLIYAGDGATVTFTDDSEIVLTDKPQRFTVTFTITGTISCFWLLFARERQEGDFASILMLSGLKLEEGNVATDWTPSVQDIEQTVEAKLELCVQTDENGVLKSVIHAKANQITIESDNFTLDGEGNMSCTNATITGGTIQIGKDDTHLSIKDGILELEQNDFRILKIDSSAFKTPGEYGGEDYTICAQFVVPGGVIFSSDYGEIASFRDDGYIKFPGTLSVENGVYTPLKVLNSNGAERITISHGEWTVPHYGTAYRDAIVSAGGLLISSNKGSNVLYLEGSEIASLDATRFYSGVFVENFKGATPAGTSSNGTEYAIVGVDISTGELIWIGG